MKIRSVPTFLLLAALALSIPSVKAEAVKTITITANDQMKFSIVKIEAKPGDKIRIVLQNIGTLPKEAMGHNWVLLKAGSDPATYAAAAMSAPKESYQPKALENQVLASIPLIGAKQSKEVTFDVPSTPVSYPFLCTFPAHFISGMKGELVVK